MLKNADADIFPVLSGGIRAKNSSVILHNRNSFNCTKRVRRRSQTTLRKLRVCIESEFLTAVARLVEALCYKPEGSGFDSRRGHWIFS
jgi:hypothetical protein